MATGCQVSPVRHPPAHHISWNGCTCCHTPAPPPTPFACLFCPSRERGRRVTPRGRRRGQRPKGTQSGPGGGGRNEACAAAPSPRCPRSRLQGRANQATRTTVPRERKRRQPRHAPDVAGRGDGQLIGLDRHSDCLERQRRSGVESKERESYSRRQDSDLAPKV
jgi:hypothetical protein